LKQCKALKAELEVSQAVDDEDDRCRVLVPFIKIR
jgi:hypothetical protein